MIKNGTNGCRPSIANNCESGQGLTVQVNDLHKK